MSFLSRTDLLGLKYPALQQIAKREGIRANSKKDVIVNLLISKYPGGVRRNQLSVREIPVNKVKEESPDNQGSSIRLSKRQRTTFSPDANQSVQNRVSGVFSSRASPVASPAPAPAPTLVTPPPPIASQITNPLPNVYCFKGARRARRKLVSLANGAAELRTDLNDTETLLKHAENMYKEAGKGVQGFLCMQRAMQIMYGSMKSDRTVLDGTYLMEPEDMEKWEAYAREQDRLKAEDLKALNKRLYDRQIALSDNYTKECQTYLAKQVEAGQEGRGIEQSPASLKRKHTVTEEDDELEYV